MIFSSEALDVYLFILLLAFSVPTIAFFLLRTWLAARITQSIKHHFDLALEQYKAELGKTTIQHHSLQSAANAALIEGQKVSAEWRVKAADTMWRNVLCLRNKTSTIILFDILVPSEYQVFVTDSAFRSSVSSIEDLGILQTPDIEQSRPFLGERLYAMVFAYRAIRARICYLLDRDVQKGHITPWFRDDGVKRLLQGVLSPEDFRDFERMPRPRIYWISNLLEAKILDDLRRVIAGTQSVDEGLEQARRILEVVQTVGPDRSEGPEL